MPSTARGPFLNSRTNPRVSIPAADTAPRGSVLIDSPGLSAKFAFRSIYLTLANIERSRYHRLQVSTATPTSRPASFDSDPEAARDAWRMIQQLSGEMKRRF